MSYGDHSTQTAVPLGRRASWLTIAIVVVATTLAIAVVEATPAMAMPSSANFHCRNSDTGWYDIKGMPKYKGAKIQYKYTGYWQDFKGTGHVHYYTFRTKKLLFWIALPLVQQKVCGTGADKKTHPKSTKSPL